MNSYPLIKQTDKNLLTGVLRWSKWLVVVTMLLIARPILNRPGAFRKMWQFKRIAKVVAFLVGFGLLFWYRQPVWEMLAIVRDREAVVAYLDQFGVVAPILLGMVLILQVFVAAIPGHILMISGSYIFGFGEGFVISLVTTVGASQGAFLLAKWAGRPVIERLAPITLLNKWNMAAETKGVIFFMFAFMLPIFPADVMNYVAGLSAMSNGRFFIANLFGRLPGLILLCALGANGLAMTPMLGVAIATAGAIMLAGWWYFLARQKGV